MSAAPLWGTNSPASWHIMLEVNRDLLERLLRSQQPVRNGSGFAADITEEPEKGTSKEKQSGNRRVTGNAGGDRILG